MSLEAADDTRPAGALAELRAEAAREDAAAPAQEPTAAAALPAASAPDKLAESVEQWRAAIDMAADELSELYPGLKAVYTEASRARLAAAIGPVAIKYNFTPFALLEKFKEEIALVLVARPIVRDTLRVIEAAKKAPAAAVVETVAAPAPAPAGAAGDSLKPNAGT